MTNKSEQAIERLNEVETRFARSPVWKSFVDGGLSLIPGLGQAISFSRVHPSRKSRGAWRGDPPKSDSLSITADLTFYADGRR